MKAPLIDPEATEVSYLCPYCETELFVPTTPPPYVKGKVVMRRCRIRPLSAARAALIIALYDSGKKWTANALSHAFNLHMKSIGAILNRP
jgi:hypothetical protein